MDLLETDRIKGDIASHWYYAAKVAACQDHLDSVKKQLEKHLEQTGDPA